MAKLLYIESSPRKERSHSIAVAHAFLDAYKAANPGDEVETWDLWAEGEQLPEFDGPAITARFAARDGAMHTEPEAEAWRVVTRSADRLKSADKLVLSAPMWNFGVPYKLKHLIDVVTQPGLTFGRDPEKGYFGLTPAKSALVIIARSGSYAEGTPLAGMDMETPYLKLWLGWIGVTGVREIFVEPASHEPGADEAAREKAVGEARAMAAGF